MSSLGSTAASKWCDIPLLAGEGDEGIGIDGQRLQRQRVEPLVVRPLVGGAELAVEPQERKLAGIPRHAVCPPEGMNELVPALGEAAQHGDTGGRTAFGDDRRVDRAAVGCPEVRPGGPDRGEMWMAVEIKDRHGPDARR